MYYQSVKLFKKPIEIIYQKLAILFYSKILSTICTNMTTKMAIPRDWKIIKNTKLDIKILQFNYLPIELYTKSIGVIFLKKLAFMDEFADGHYL